MSLSDKIIGKGDWKDNLEGFIPTKDVKQAVRELGEELETELDKSDINNEGVICHNFEECWNKVARKIFGEKLI